MSHASEEPLAPGVADPISAMPSHPYYPLDLEFPDYVPNTLSTISILLIFFFTLSAVLAPMHVFIRRYNPKLPLSEVATALWFVLCGIIHLGLEGSYTLFFFFWSCFPYIPLFV